jgi:predicted nucleic acid-binding Zn ribbon protein
VLAVISNGSVVAERSVPTIMQDPHCPSCGMLIPAGPHGDSTQCIHALEQEIHRLQLLLRVKRSEKVSGDRSRTPPDTPGD